VAGRDLLERLRPTGAPGGVGPVAVPADDAVRNRELEPVFRSLEDTVAECDRIARDADRAAAEHLARADRDAQQWVAEARLAAAEQRAAAAAAVRREADVVAAALIAEAEAEAARLQVSGRTALDPLVERIVARVRADLDAGTSAEAPAAAPPVPANRHARKASSRGRGAPAGRAPAGRAAS